MHVRSLSASVDVWPTRASVLEEARAWAQAQANVDLNNPISILYSAAKALPLAPSEAGEGQASGPSGLSASLSILVLLTVSSAA